MTLGLLASAYRAVYVLEMLQYWHGFILGGIKPRHQIGAERFHDYRAVFTPHDNP
jgi:hypothetical protein